MALNNLENQIKNKLNSREIQPSANSWDRLDAMLAITEKPKKKFPWLLVAACFIGFVFIGTIIFNNNTMSPAANHTDLPTIVSSENRSKQTDVTTTDNSIKQAQKQNENNVITNNKPQAKNSNRVSIISNNQNQIAVIKQQKNENISNNTKALEINKIEDVASINPEIEPQQVENINIKINANTLLSQVDNELKTEYRETVFQKISKKYQTVKTAFVERNNQK